MASKPLKVAIDHTGRCKYTWHLIDPAGSIFCKGELRSVGRIREFADRQALNDAAKQTADDPQSGYAKVSVCKKCFESADARAAG